jgi:hypothetical protein
MATFNIPTNPPYFVGQQFNPSFTQSTTGITATVNDLKPYFLTYPNAQGRESLQDTNIFGDLLLSASSTFTSDVSLKLDTSGTYIQFPDGTQQFSAYNNTDISNSVFKNQSNTYVAGFTQTFVGDVNGVGANAPIVFTNTTTTGGTGSIFVDPNNNVDITIYSAQNGGGLTVRNPYDSFTVNPANVNNIANVASFQNPINTTGNLSTQQNIKIFDGSTFANYTNLDQGNNSFSLTNYAIGSQTNFYSTNSTSQVPSITYNANEIDLYVNNAPQLVATANNVKINNTLNCATANLTTPTTSSAGCTIMRNIKGTGEIGIIAYNNNGNDNGMNFYTINAGIVDANVVPDLVIPVSNTSPIVSTHPIQVPTLTYPNTTNTNYLATVGYVANLAPLASPALTGTATLNGQNIATSNQLASYAPLASPALTGTATLNGQNITTSNQLASYAPLASPALTGTATLNGQTIATVNQIPASAQIYSGRVSCPWVQTVANNGPNVAMYTAGVFSMNTSVNITLPASYANSSAFTATATMSSLVNPNYSSGGTQELYGMWVSTTNTGANTFTVYVSACMRFNNSSVGNAMPSFNISWQTVPYS